MAATSSDSSARARLLDAALLLFRQRGFHGVGVAEILAAAQSPKGSLYHHFPGGKTELAVAVVSSIEDGLNRLIDSHVALDTASMVRKVGAQVSKWMQRTGGDACALLASFAAPGDAAASLRQAVGQAYRSAAGRFEARLRRDGWSAVQARQRASLVLALFEGGGILAQARNDTRQFSIAIEHAANLCERP